MPGSSPNGKRFTVHVVTELQRRGLVDSVLDIGPGAGTYSDLLRESVPGFWACVEIWAPYAKEYGLDRKYDRVVIGDARYVDFGLIRPGKFGLAFMGDVLEHVFRGEAQRIVDRILHVSRIAAISIPIVHAPQGEHFGNPFETHLVPDWTSETVLDAFPDIALGCVSGGNIGVYFLTREAAIKGVLSRIAETADRAAVDAIPLRRTAGMAPESEMPAVIFSLLLLHRH